MNSDGARFNRRLVLFVLVSFAVFLSAVVLRVGIGQTPDATVDSAGRRMGFNDPLSAEHYLIMVRNFSFPALFKVEHLYEWILLAAHLIGAKLLLSSNSAHSRFTRWYFAVQPALFPLGIPTLFFLPSTLAGFFSRMDREGFVDVPFIWMIAHPVWGLTAIIVAVALHGPGFRRAGAQSGLTAPQTIL